MSSKTAARATINIHLESVEYRVAPTPREDTEIDDYFLYSIQNQEDPSPKERQWRICVHRYFEPESVYEARMVYLVLAECARKPASEAAYQKALALAIDIVADKASHLIASMTNDTFMRPFITRPILDEAAIEADKDAE